MQKQGGNVSWDEESVIENACRGQWGLSSLTLPEITAYMRCESVFFSSNRSLHLDNASIQSVCGLLKDFADKKNLKVMTAIYELTMPGENIYADKVQITEKCGLASETEENCLAEMDAYLEEKNVKGQCRYRFMGMYERVLPILAMLSVTA